MCGITAISRATERSSIYNPRIYLETALLGIEERGKDATGAAWVHPDSRAFYWKTAKPAHEAIRDIRFPSDLTVAIGHVRLATQGDKKYERNNHPVVEDGIMLVHNGVISNEHELYGYLGAEYVPPAEVDSQSIAAALANPEAYGCEHPAEVLEYVNGSYAVAWIDMSEPQVLHLARGSASPMTVAYTRLGDLVMSSTLGTLENLERWARIKLRHKTSIAEGTYMRVEAGEITEVREFEPAKNSKVSAFSRHSGSYGGGWGGHSSSYTVPRGDIDDLRPSFAELYAEHGDAILPCDDPTCRKCKFSYSVYNHETEKFYGCKFRPTPELDGPTSVDTEVVDAELVDPEHDFSDPYCDCHDCWWERVDEGRPSADDELYAKYWEDQKREELAFLAASIIDNYDGEDEAELENQMYELSDTPWTEVDWGLVEEYRQQMAEERYLEARAVMERVAEQEKGDDMSTDDYIDALAEARLALPVGTFNAMAVHSDGDTDWSD